MSRLDEKLEPTVATTGTTARATLKQLQQRWGILVLTRDAEEARILNTMKDTEVWRRVSGRGQQALYELVPEGDPGQ